LSKIVSSHNQETEAIEESEVDISLLDRGNDHVGDKPKPNGFARELPKLLISTEGEEPLLLLSCHQRQGFSFSISQLEL
jgi:hypothetical protein